MSSSDRLLVRIVGEESAPAELPRAGVLVIGSSKERAGFVVEGQGVADVHCAIGIVKGGGWAVKDMGSEFGTLVNGKKIQSKRVKLGDVILLGSKRLTIVSSEELAAAETAKPAQEAKAEPEKAQSQKAKIQAELSETQRAPLLGGYRVERTLGRGAMGKVFLAVQESLDRQVALKVMAPHLAKDAAFVKSFQAEARAAASLTHPNVVIVHDVGEQKGFHYLSMEYMDRGSVEELLSERGRLSHRETLEILRDAASGLVYAESRGIVHRDIKPANLMRNHQGATKIADLGLAVNVEAESELKDEGGKKVFGTPHFISPEQLRGETVDCRSDLYSLGATIYQLLTGETPFEGETTREILRGHLFEPAPRVREIASEVPKELDDLVARLLEKDPADRYPSAGTLLADVQRLLAREGGGSSGVPSEGGGSKLVPIAVLVLLLVGAGLFFGGVFDGPGEPERPDPDHVAVEGGPVEPENPGAADVDNTDGTLENSGNGETTGSNTADTNDTDTDENLPHDRDLRIFELEAESAFLRLAQEDLTTPRRVERLREVAAKYPGTDAARTALEQATELENASAVEAQRVTQLASDKSKVFEALRFIANLNNPTPTPAATLQSLAEHKIPNQFAGDPALIAERKRLEGLVIQKALDFADEKNAAAQAAGKEDDRANFLAHLAAIVNTLDVPVMEGEEALEGLAKLREARTAAKQQMDQVDTILAQYRQARATEASLQMASAFGGAQGLEQELRRLDLAAARQRIEAGIATMPTAEGKQTLERLRDDLNAAQSALEHLGGSFANWRRKKVDDPRTGRVDTATGATKLGISIDSEFVPWAEFGGKTAALSNLFEGRFDGGYSAEQTRGIIAVLRISAALEVVDNASEMFFPKERAQFTSSEALELPTAYESLFSWLDDSSDAALVAALEHERDAARLLATTLRSTDQEQWTQAVAGIERLLSEYANTLVVLLMSDGTS